MGIVKLFKNVTITQKGVGSFAIGRKHHCGKSSSTISFCCCFERTTHTPLPYLFIRVRYMFRQQLAFKLSYLQLSILLLLQVLHCGCFWNKNKMHYFNGNTLCRILLFYFSIFSNLEKK